MKYIMRQRLFVSIWLKINNVLHRYHGGIFKSASFMETTLIISAQWLRAMLIDMRRLLLAMNLNSHGDEHCSF